MPKFPKKMNIVRWTSFCLVCLLSSCKSAGPDPELSKPNESLDAVEGENQKWKIAELPESMADLLSTYLEVSGLKSRKQTLTQLDSAATVEIYYFKIRIYNHFVIQYSGKLGHMGPIIRSALSRYDFVGEVKNGRHYLYKTKEDKHQPEKVSDVSSFSQLSELNKARVQSFMEFAGYIHRGANPLTTLDRNAFSIQKLQVGEKTFELISAVKSAHRIGGIFRTDSSQLLGLMSGGKILFWELNPFDPELDP